MLPPYCSATPGHIAYAQSDAECNKSGQVTRSPCPSLNENLMMPFSCFFSSSALQNLNYSCKEGNPVNYLHSLQSQSSPPAQPPGTLAHRACLSLGTQSSQDCSKQPHPINQMAHEIKPIYLL